MVSKIQQAKGATYLLYIERLNLHHDLEDSLGNSRLKDLGAPANGLINVGIGTTAMVTIARRTL